ncbi:putative GTPase effector domain-containing protein [Helianthus anomalus]
MFHDASIKDLKKKMSFLEKEKEKAEAERDELKKKLEELSKVNEEIKSVMIKHAKKIKKMEGDVDDNAKLFELLSTQISDLHVKNKKLNEINQTLNQLLSELHEVSTNEFKAMKLEMEALRADKAVKDEQLNMLYTVMEQHLGINVQSIYNNVEIQRVVERRAQREKDLAEEATKNKKELIVETQEAGGSSSQADVEMVDAEVDPEGFVLVGDCTPLSYNFDDVTRIVKVE